MNRQPASSENEPPPPAASAPAPTSASAPTYCETMKSKGGFSRLFRAALYTRDGLLEALRHEHAFRQELFAVLPLAAVAIGLGVFHKIHWQDAALLCASLLLILVVELLNSAIEACVDYVSTARHPLAKRAKDMGSAAVSLAIGIAVVTWGGVLASWLFG